MYLGNYKFNNSFASVKPLFYGDDGGAGQAIPSTPDPNDVNYQDDSGSVDNSGVQQQQPSSDFWSTYGVYIAGIGAGIVGYLLFFHKKK